MTEPKCINADHLLRFLKDEAAERMSAMKPTDSVSEQDEDTGFLAGLEVVASYVIAAIERAA